MYIRVKKIRGRRYAYLVEGVREKGRVRQKTICYLGSMATTSWRGLSESARASLEKRGIDWRLVNKQLGELTRTFDELEQARLARYVLPPGRRNRRGIREVPRVDGELLALTKIARAEFEATFEQIGDTEYRMR